MANGATTRQKLALMRTVERDLPEGVTYANITFDQAAQLLDGLEFIPPSDAALLFAADYGIKVKEDTSSWELAQLLDERGPRLQKTGSATYAQRKALLRAIGVEWPEGTDIMSVTFDQARKMLDECVLLPPSDDQLVLAAELDVEVSPGISSAGLTEILNVAIELAHKDADAAKAELISRNPAIEVGNMVVIDDLLYRIARIYKRRGQWFAHLETVQTVRNMLNSTERVYRSVKAIPLINLAEDAKQSDLMSYLEKHSSTLK